MRNLGGTHHRVPTIRTASTRSYPLDADNTAQTARYGEHTLWRRCQVHFTCNALAHAGRSGRRVVSAFIATAFARDDAEQAKAQWRRVADQLRPKVPKLATLMYHAEPDVLAYLSFPAQHRIKLHSTNPLERPNGEIRRRTEVVGIFPTRPPSPESSVPSCSNRTMSGPSTVLVTSRWKASHPWATIPSSACPSRQADRRLGSNRTSSVSTTSYTHAKGRDPVRPPKTMPLRGVDLVFLSRAVSANHSAPARSEPNGK